MKLFLLDAYALIYRAYYALIRMPMINSKGVNTSAIFGFINTLEEILKKENPTHIGVAFDSTGPTFRHEAYGAYKAQREKMPEVIRFSIPVIKNIIHAYNIPILEVPYYEADDIIGTMTKQLSKDYQIFMMTPDKDYVQLVDDNIFIYKPKHGNSAFEILDVEEVKKRYGLKESRQMIDFLGLMGDTSDNIPGCPGVGEVTAKKLITNFGSIENLLKNTDQLKGALRTKIKENKEMILISKFLATIKTDVPFNICIDDLIRKEIDELALRKIFNELEFRQLSMKIFEKVKWNVPIVYPKSVQLSFFDEIIKNQSNKNVIDYSDCSRLKSTQHNYILLDNDRKIAALVERIRTQQSFTFDIETTGLDSLSSELVGISIALRENEAFYLPMPEKKEEVIQTLTPLKELLENQHILKIGQNLKYDINVLRKYGMHLAGPMFDTMIAHYLINPESQHNMNYLSEIYLHYRTIHIEELIGRNGKNQLSMRQVPLDQIVNYACENADVTLKLKHIFENILNKEQLSDLFFQIEMPLILVLADMEAAGVRLDISALQDSSIILTKNLRMIEQNIFQMVGESFNISSPKRVGEILFDRLKIVSNSRKTKLGQYITNEDMLESLKNKHPVVNEILEYRKIRKLLSTYIDALPALISPEDGKVHTTYNQSTTSTGRLSSTNPNLQNIPIHNEEGKEIRRAFISDDNCLFLSADYSQIELRIMAHLSEDKNMLEAFRSGQDIHTATAAKIFNIPLNDVSRNMRQKAKTANFGIIYGISIFGLAEQLHIPRSGAKELIDGYFSVFPDVKAYMKYCIATAKENGYAETIFRRRRFLPDIYSQNTVVRSYAERNAINTPIQGSAADIIKIAMNKISQCLKDMNLQSCMIMQVHDELTFNVLLDEAEQVKQIVVHEMEQAIKLKVPLVAKCGVGRNWMEAHS